MGQTVSVLASCDPVKSNSPSDANSSNNSGGFEQQVKSSVRLRHAKEAYEVFEKHHQESQQI